MPYFDWNATAPLLPEAREAWLAAVDSDWANPSTSYRAGARARVVLEEARENLAEQVGCDPGQVIFTSGATEANNGMLREAARRSGPDGKILISAVEHPSVVEAAYFFWGANRVQAAPVDTSGAIDLGWFRDHLDSDPPAFVSIMAANNETGVIQPWREARDLCRSKGVPFHCDAVQWFGKEAQADWNGCAAVTLSGHKFGGPKGVGCLVLGDEWKGIRIQCGGSQELDSRAGTENIPAVVSMMTALQARQNSPLSDDRRTARDTFESRLRDSWPGEVTFNGAGATRLWNTCSVTLPEFRSERWIAQLDRLGFQVSSGSACSTGKSSPSAVLHAMGIGDEAIRRTLRISSGWETQSQDWEKLLEALRTAREKLGGEPPSSGPATVIEI